MPNEYIDISDLIKSATSFLHEQNCYGKKNGKYIESTWKQFLKFCNDNGYNQYSSFVKDKFVEHFTNWVPSLKPEIITLKSSHMQMLDLFAHNGKWTTGNLHPKPELTENFSSFIRELDVYLTKHDYSQNTRMTSCRLGYSLLLFFQNSGLSDMKQIEHEHITSYAISLKGHARSTMHCQLSQIRRILHHAYIWFDSQKSFSSYLITSYYQ